jgi:hypothetical protein
MKRIIKTMTRNSMMLITLLSFSFVLLTSCTNDRGNMNGNQGPAPKPFQTSEEAVAQGKKDLMEALRLNPELKMGFDAAQLEKSQPEPALSVTDIDFQKLLQADNPDSLDKLAGTSRGNTTPLAVDGRVIGMIETRKDAEGWRVSAIGNQAVGNDLNAIKGSGFGKGKLSYFEVPNLNVRIYAVSVDGKEGYLTDYNGFSLQKPATIAELVPQLRRDALEFQRQYGDKLKDQKLTK